MILIPLGPGQKPPYFPVFTLGMVAVIVALSVLYFPRIKNFEELSAQDFESGEMPKKLIAFSLDYCPTQKLTPEKCAIADEILSLLLIREKTKEPNGKAAHDRESAATGKKRVTELLTKEIRIDPKHYQELVDYLNRIRGFRGSNDPHIQSLASYDSWMRAVQESDQKTIANLNSKSLLSRYSFSWKSILLAQFIHAGWGHLLGNLFVLLSFMIYLEQRGQILAVLAIYFLGGTGGLCFELYKAGPAPGPLLGASANVAAVMGAYFVYYFHRKTKWLFSIIVYNKIIEAPSWLLIPLIFVLQDFVGFANSLNHANDGVAHGAHLMGFAIGAALGLLNKNFENLPEHFLYPIEMKIFASFRQSRDLRKKLGLASEILSYNPENSTVRMETIQLMLAEKNPSAEHLALTQNFIDQNLHLAWNELNKTEQFAKLNLILSNLPKSIRLQTSLSKVSSQSLLNRAQKMLEGMDWQTSVRLMAVYCAKAPNSQEAQRASQRLLNTLAKLQFQESDLQSFPILLAACAPSQLTLALSQRYLGNPRTSHSAA